LLVLGNERRQGWPSATDVDGSIGDARWEQDDERRPDSNQRADIYAESDRKA
jgi:hypothetical protein